MNVGPDAKPMSEEDREREIQRLERVRDMLLDEAPKHFISSDYYCH
jgi:hypothetical protein